MLHLNYTSFSLSNGLKVYVHEDSSVPKAVINILYKVGSKDEEPQKTGFAHLFEHLMFEGSENIPHYDEELQKVGGENNAFTSCDITNYYLSLPSNQLETGFWLESDRMLKLAFSQERLDNQKSVVIEEFKQRYLNQPYGDAMNLLRGLHFKKHPYRWATIGKDISHVEEATLDYVESFFYGYYAPNNAVLVVAGDVSTEEVKRLSEKWFGDIPARPLKKHPLPQEPRQRKARFMEKKGDVPFIGVYKMFHIPAHTTQEFYVMDMITDLLSNGKTGKLFQDLVQTQSLANSISAFTWGMAEPGALSINAQLSDGVSTAAYEAALAVCIGELQDLTEEDLVRIKNKLQSSFLVEKMHLLNKAMGLAFADYLGNVDLVNQTAQIYQSITLQQIKKAAARYLVASNSSTLYYLPK